MSVSESHAHYLLDVMGVSDSFADIVLVLLRGHKMENYVDKKDYIGEYIDGLLSSFNRHKIRRKDY